MREKQTGVPRERWQGRVQSPAALGPTSGVSDVRALPAVLGSSPSSDSTSPHLPHVAEGVLTHWRTVSVRVLIQRRGAVSCRGEGSDRMDGRTAEGSPSARLGITGLPPSRKRKAGQKTRAPGTRKVKCN